jgi:hypothetical protein
MVVLGLVGFAASIATLALAIRILIIGSNRGIRIALLASSSVIAVASVSLLFAQGW